MNLLPIFHDTATKGGGVVDGGSSAVDGEEALRRWKGRRGWGRRCRGWERKAQRSRGKEARRLREDRGGADGLGRAWPGDGRRQGPGMEGGAARRGREMRSRDGAVGGGGTVRTGSRAQTA